MQTFVDQCVAPVWGNHLPQREMEPDLRVEGNGTVVPA
jgi:hypothetical protein